jgi:hypothetical protein
VKRIREEWRHKSIKIINMSYLERRLIAIYPAPDSLSPSASRAEKFSIFASTALSFFSVQLSHTKKKKHVEALKHFSSRLRQQEEEFKREQKATNDPLLINFFAFSLSNSSSEAWNQLAGKKAEPKAFPAPLSKTNFSHYVINESQAHSTR